MVSYYIYFENGGDFCFFPDEEDMLKYVKDIMEDNGIGLKDMLIIKGEELQLNIEVRT
jgi:hypothetical protein